MSFSEVILDLVNGHEYKEKNLFEIKKKFIKEGFSEKDTSFIKNNLSVSCLKYFKERYLNEAEKKINIEIEKINSAIEKINEADKMISFPDTSENLIEYFFKVTKNIFNKKK